ncbi:MAG: DEAD/DEAH box helicase, partial [Sphingomicrobium sp.]
MLDRARAGRSALLVAATGAGKTLAGFLPSICELVESPSEGLHTLYVSPLKALAVDVQRNLICPVEEMGLPIRVETRTGDTPSDRKARQRVRPPQMLLTTPESLSLLLSYPDAAMMFENLRTIVVDELHGFAKEKRGDLLSLSMSRLQRLAPGLRRVGLSATISDPDAYRSWLAPDADMELVDLVIGDPGADPDLSILIPENKIPWGGHSGYHAVPEVMRLIEEHKTTLVFCNTRGL